METSTTRRITLLTVLIFLSSLNTFGQAIKTDFDKKIIFTDSLNLPRNTSAITLLTLLPELLQRPGVFIISNYDVQVEGMSVGAASDVALYDLQIVDIEKVEVSESPVSSYQKNGQGGSINLVLRSHGDGNDSYWGSGGTVASSSIDIAPQFFLGYRKDKLMMRGIMLAEWSNLTNDTQTLTYNDDKFVGQSFTTNESRARTALARLYTQYNFSAKDMLQFNISEIYTYSRTFKRTDFSELNSVWQSQKSMNLQALAKYQHKSRRSTFTAQAEYKYSPLTNRYNIPETYSYDNDMKSNTISGKLEYKAKLLDSTTSHGDAKNAEIIVGSNFNSNLGKETTIMDDINIVEIITRHIPRNDTYYIMPYMTFSGTFGKFRIKATGEFQHFKYNIERYGVPYSAISNDFTGKLMAEWHFTDNRNLRFILDRKLQRPSAEQLHPDRRYDPKQMIYIEGNPDLLPTMVHEVAVDYISHYSWHNYHNIIINIGASFNNITDIITSQSTSQSIKPGTIGSVQRYISYENNGSNHIANANLMALYTYKAFSLSFTGNMYHKLLDDQGSNKHYTYYNLSLNPYFNLKDGWHGGASIVYFSRIDQTNGYIGDCTTTNITIGKSWKKFFIYLVDELSLGKDNKDVFTTDDKRTEQHYKLYQSYAGIGVKYTF